MDELVNQLGGLTNLDNDSIYKFIKKDLVFSLNKGIPTEHFVFHYGRDETRLFGGFLSTLRLGATQRTNN